MENTKLKKQDQFNNQSEDSKKLDSKVDQNNQIESIRDYSFESGERFRSDIYKRSYRSDKNLAGKDDDSDNDLDYKSDYY